MLNPLLFAGYKFNPLMYGVNYIEFPDDMKIEDVAEDVWIIESSNDRRRSAADDLASNGQALSSVPVPGPVPNQAPADLQNAQLTSALLVGAKLTGALLMGASRADTDFSGPKLTAANFYWAAFQRSNMANETADGIKLQNSSLLATMFDNAEMGGADMRGSIIGGTSFAGANLSNANFAGAVLSTPGSSRSV